MSNPALARRQPPVPFGKYLLLDRINIGGMAEVWRAKTFEPNSVERIVAIKRILPNIAEDDEFIAMFIDEAKITVQLQHANIAQIYELGQIGSSYFISLEYIAGKDMRAIFDRARKQGEPAPIPLSCYLVSRMCEGLDYAHRKKDTQGRDMNIVHRDVSPQNVLVGYEGEVKLIDFGIAKAAGKATKTQAGILKGKFGYMSPEQVRGLPLDGRSDVFAAGICLYEMLTGERLFFGDSDFAVLEAVRKAEVLPPSTYNPKVPPELDRIALKALARDVEDRYASAMDLSEELARFLLAAGMPFGRRELTQYMKSAFAEEVEREKQRAQEYSQVKPPPGWSPPALTVPATPIARLKSGASTPAAPRISSSQLPKLTAAAPLLTQTRDELPQATVLVDGSEYQKELEAKEQLQEEEVAPTDIRDPAPTIPEPIFAPKPSAPKPADLGPAPPPPQAPSAIAERAVPVVKSRVSLEAVPAPANGPLPRPPTEAEAWAVLQYSRAVWLVGGAAVAALLLLGGILGALLVRSSTPEGVLVLSLPEEAHATARVNVNGAELTEDGKPRQRWPAQLSVPAGVVSVLVTAEGFEPFRKEVDVLPGNQSTTLVVKLSPRAVPVARVSVAPVNAEVKIDGKPLAVDAKGLVLVPLPDATPRVLEVTAKGHEPHTRPLGAGDRGANLSIGLVPIEFSVRVTSSPSNATIWVGEKALGQTPATVRLNGAVTSLTLKRRCHEAATVPLQLGAPGGDRVEVSLQRLPRCR